VGMVRTSMARGWVAKLEELLCKNHVNRSFRAEVDAKATHPNPRLPHADPYRFFPAQLPPLGAAE
jgi:hypothetical protein